MKVSDLLFNILNRLTAIETTMTENTEGGKNVLTVEEAANYMGVSRSHLYKLTMRGEIPHYKPTGKMCYFNRAELEEWLQHNRISTHAEIADRANRLAMKGGRK